MCISPLNFYITYTLTEVASSFPFYETHTGISVRIGTTRSNRLTSNISLAISPSTSEVERSNRQRIQRTPLLQEDRENTRELLNTYIYTCDDRKLLWRSYDNTGRLNGWLTSLIKNRGSTQCRVLSAAVKFKQHYGVFLKKGISTPNPL